ASGRSGWGGEEARRGGRGASPCEREGATFRSSRRSPLIISIGKRRFPLFPTSRPTLTQTVAPERKRSTDGATGQPWSRPGPPALHRRVPPGGEGGWGGGGGRGGAPSPRRLDTGG